MKRKMKMFLPLVCLAVLLMGMTVLAAEWDKTNYCETCDAALRSGAREAGHWTTTHQVSTNLVDSDGNPIYEVCTRTHVNTVVEKFCPNGHGVKWSGTQYDEYHTCSRCEETHTGPR